MQKPSEKWLDATGQRWKLRAAYLFIAVMFGFFAIAVITEDADIRLFAVWMTAGVVALILAGSIRCLVCGAFLGCRALKRWDTAGALEQLTACPDCGARSNDDKLV